MQVAVIGAGHVGLVTAACLARIGHDVVANDDDQAKLERLAAGRPWFHEPGLPELLAETSAPAGCGSAPTRPRPSATARSSSSASAPPAGPTAAPT